MHELGIATSILETVEAEAKRHPGAQFTEVGVRIGGLAGVDVDSLTFGWEAITKDTKWESLKLAVEQVPRRNRCGACGNEFAVEDYKVDCPRCGTFSTFCIGGDELEIAYIEADELEGAEA